MSEARLHLIAEEPLDDLLLALEAQRASVVVHIETPVGHAEVSIALGELRGASYLGLEGDQVIAEILSATEGTYRLHPVSEAPRFSGTLFQPGGLRPTTDSAMSKGPDLRKLVLDALPPQKTPLVLQRLQATGINPRSETGTLGRSIIGFFREPKTGIEVVLALLEAAPEILQAMRVLLAEGALRSVSVAPTSSTRGALIPSRRVLITDSTAPMPRTAKSPLPPLMSRAAHPPVSEPFEPAPSVARIDSHAESFIAKPRFGSTMPSNMKVSPETRAALALVFEEHSAESGSAESGSADHGAAHPSTPSDSVPPSFPDSSSFTGRTFINGTVPDVLREGGAQGPGRSQEEVPSRRFEKETLAQLEQLNAKSNPFASDAAQDFQAGRDPRSGSAVRAAHDLRTTQPSHTAVGLHTTAGSHTSAGSHATAASHGSEFAPSDQSIAGGGASSAYPRVGRYEVLARLKSGGMGAVYLCRTSGSAGFERLFAMKVLKDVSVASAEGMADFFREARLLAALHHPNIVGVFDVGSEGEPYLVLDYVEGGSLHELLQASEQRDPALIVTVFIDALMGLHAAHQARDRDGNLLQLVHGDVTPHNLLVGTDGACRVADFGIAKTREGGTSILRGKPGYVAPEVLRGELSDQRADVFSMGVSLYVALTGIEPFAAESTEQIVKNVALREVDPPSMVGTYPPPALDWVCMRAMEKDPSARFASAEEMLVNLRRIAARQDYLATPSQVAAWVTGTLGGRIEKRRALVRSLETPSVIPPPYGESEAPPPPTFQAMRDLPRALDSSPISTDRPEKTIAIDPSLAPPGEVQGEKLRLVLAFALLALLLIALVAFGFGSTDNAETEGAGPGAPQGKSAPVKAAPPKPAANDLPPPGDEVVIPPIEPGGSSK